MTSSTFSPYQNTSPYARQLRQPRAIILINGMPVLWTSLEVITTTFYIADTYRIEIPLNQQNSTLDFNYWASAGNFTVQIYTGFPSNAENYSTSDLDLLIIGDADEIEVDTLSARVMLRGRDYTQKFIDNRIVNKYPNQTSSQIVTNLAKAQGLKTNITPTTNIVGTYYNSQNVLTSKDIPQWDLICYLANQENYFAYVFGDTLYFNPKTYDLSNAFTLQYQSPSIDNASPSFNGMELGLFRSTTLAGDVSVTVKVPYNMATGKAFYGHASLSHRSRSYLKNVPAPSNKVQRYSFIIPGLTPQQAQDKANQIAQNITSHEVRLTARLPANNLLFKNGVVQLKGTNTAYDQIYYTDQIVRRMNYTEGYIMDISAKNVSTDTQVTL